MFQDGVELTATTVSPERTGRGYTTENRDLFCVSGMRHSCRQTEFPYFAQQLRTDVRLRVRAEYLEHESALRGSVSSDKRQPLERQFELFSQASSLLHSRDLGSIVCDIRFTELENLEAFWSDYLSGALLEALKGVFITDSLRMAAGMEGVCLLISVDQDDYEEGRKLLGARKGLSSDGVKDLVAMVTKLGPDSGSPVMQYDGDQKDRDQKPLQELINAAPLVMLSEYHIGIQ
ncbi:hypothetical protein F2P81_002084 [Scophthalmus maximus]|uniref:TRADD-like N-terminal domain-containing protein n=1 Tax=Scophthalmus maximus TaxID=52904 RepID=A0A6A4TK25_SCOMX|nr:hypothetical protein F2P81_002084 [Scophthalmus maximus]